MTDWLKLKNSSRLIRIVLVDRSTILHFPLQQSCKMEIWSWLSDYRSLPPPPSHLRRIDNSEQKWHVENRSYRHLNPRISSPGIPASRNWGPEDQSPEPLGIWSGEPRIKFISGVEVTTFFYRSWSRDAEVPNLWGATFSIVPEFGAEVRGDTRVFLDPKQEPISNTFETEDSFTFMPRLELQPNSKFFNSRVLVLMLALGLRPFFVSLCSAFSSILPTSTHTLSFNPSATWIQNRSWSQRNKNHFFGAGVRW